MAISELENLDKGTVTRYMHTCTYMYIIFAQTYIHAQIHTLHIAQVMLKLNCPLMHSCVCMIHTLIPEEAPPPRGSSSKESPPPARELRGLAAVLTYIETQSTESACTSNTLSPREKIKLEISSYKDIPSLRYILILYLGRKWNMHAFHTCPSERL